MVTSPPVFRCDYNVYSTFQSHEPEFDYLKSLEIEEKINQICWVKQTGSSLFLLTTNGEKYSILGICGITSSPINHPLSVVAREFVLESKQWYGKCHYM